MISLANVSYSYKNNKQILKNINLNIQKNEIIMIIGKNGSGKSTLCILIANILKGKGKILLDDVKISKIKNKELRKKIGIVFQNPNNQIIFDKVIDELNFVLENLNLDGKETRINNALNTMNISNLKEENPYEMSLGQKQRIAIACQIAIDPDYFIFDEITSMIDYKGKKDIYKLINNLKKRNKTIIYSTNIMEELILADRIIILNNGEIKKILKKDELLDNLNILKEIDLEIPLNLQILKLLKDKNIDIKDYYEENILKILEEKL